MSKEKTKKKQKKDRKQTEKQNFLVLGDLVRSTNKVFIESNSLRFWLASFFAPTATYMMERLRGKVMWQRLTKIRYFLSRKELETVVFVKEEFLLEKIQKKRCFRIFDHKLTEEGKCETEWSMKACEGYKVIEKFDKVCS